MPSRGLIKCRNKFFLLQGESKIADVFFFSVPAQFKPPQAFVVDRSAAQIQFFYSPAQKTADRLPHDQVISPQILEGVVRCAEFVNRRTPGMKENGACNGLFFPSCQKNHAEIFCQNVFVNIFKKRTGLWRQTMPFARLAMQRIKIIRGSGFRGNFHAYPGLFSLVDGAARGTFQLPKQRIFVHRQSQAMPVKRKRRWRSIEKPVAAAKFQIFPAAQFAKFDRVAKKVFESGPAGAKGIAIIREGQSDRTFPGQPAWYFHKRQKRMERARSSGNKIERFIAVCFRQNICPGRTVKKRTRGVILRGEPGIPV
ncbi:MAG TPA: hypothetical protein VNU95_14350 [Candidatus Acidoferrales bacterium]|nr:hypothetical protein [Candidatus Acidoferrales bacterium]